MLALFFYNLFLFFFQLGSRIWALFNKKAALWVKGRLFIFSKLKDAFEKEQAPVIWFHCASLGEFEQGRPVMEDLKAKYPTHKILVTFFSPSGYEIRKNYSGADYVFYLPMDGPVNALRFINIVKPRLAVFIKYELWYYYTKVMHDRQIPLILISAIFLKSHAYFKWHGEVQRKTLSKFAHVFVQDELSKKLADKLQLPVSFTVAGDTRFDRVIKIASQYKRIDAITDWAKGKQLVVAGSTWPDDERVLSEILPLLQQHQLKLVIAPHEINESHLGQIEKQFQQQTVRFSQLVNNITGEVLIIDNIGMLSSLYHYAHITYIGGGYTPTGIHNCLEAAVYAKPVVFGPTYQKYAEAKGLIKAGGAFSFKQSGDLNSILTRLIKDKQAYLAAATAAGEFVIVHQGATDKIVQYIQENRLLTS
jgi:3-deoxy-D-manno-octulosonic-acid transferase